MEPSLCGFQNSGEVAGRRDPCVLALVVFLLLAANTRSEDVSLRFGADESGHLHRALARLNMRERDTGFLKDVGKPLWALSWVRNTLQAPLALPDYAERIREATGSNAEVEVWALAGDLLEIGGIPTAPPLLSSNSTDRFPNLDRNLEVCLREFTSRARQVQRQLELAYAGLAGEQKSLLAASCLCGTFNIEDHPEIQPFLSEAGIASQDVRRVVAGGLELDPEPSATNLFAAARTIRMGDLLTAGAWFHAAVLRLAGQVLPMTNWPSAPMVFDTSAGRIVVGSRGDDCYTNSALLILDPGGEDRYGGGAGVANGLCGQPLAAVVDLCGCDRYEGHGLFGPGSALFGISVLDDVEGDDVHCADFAGQGVGLYGASWVEDAAGADVYKARALAQGAAIMGIGVLRDEGGGDLYDIGFSGQAFSGTRGAAFLIDRAGHDRYLAGGRERDWERNEDRFLSLSQGCSLGDRPFTGGGIAALVDWEGNDSYVADVYGQGVGYWYGAGFLLDMGGNDVYQMYQYGQGAGIHLSLGCLWDACGNDVYSGHALVQGVAHDYSVGMLLDRQGNDTYTGDSSTQGRALYNSFALLLDSGGDDCYFGGRSNECQGIGHDGGIRHYGSLAMLVDLAGDDLYSCGATNGCRLLRPWYGIVYDVRTNAVEAK